MTRFLGKRTVTS